MVAYMLRGLKKSEKLFLLKKTLDILLDKVYYSHTDRAKPSARMGRKAKGSPARQPGCQKKYWRRQL
jgi:hypothetical protein